MKSYTPEEIAHLLHGSVEHPDNPRPVQLQGVADIAHSQAHHLSFVSKKEYERLAYDTQAGALLVSKDFVCEKAVPCALIRVAHVYEALRLFLEALQKEQYTPKTGTETPAYLGKRCRLGKDIYRGAFSYIGQEAEIGDGVQIYPHVYIGDRVRIGEGSILYAGARIYAGVNIGKQCIIHAGAVIGSDGFGYAADQEGRHTLIPQIGTVVLEDDVHIGANTTIDRATFDKTVIAEGTRLDNLIQIGHNVHIGKHTVMAAQVGIAGSAKIGDYCMVGGQAGIVGHLQVGAYSRIGPQAGVSKAVDRPREMLIGSPAMTIREYTAWLRTPRQLDKLEKRLNEYIKAQQAHSPANT